MNLNYFNRIHFHQEIRRNPIRTFCSRTCLTPCINCSVLICMLLLLYFITNDNYTRFTDINL